MSKYMDFFKEKVKKGARASFDFAKESAHSGFKFAKAEFQATRIERAKEKALYDQVYKKELKKQKTTVITQKAKSAATRRVQSKPSFGFGNVLGDDPLGLRSSKKSDSKKSQKRDNSRGWL